MTICTMCFGTKTMAGTIGNKDLSGNVQKFQPGGTASVTSAPCTQCGGRGFY